MISDEHQNSINYKNLVNGNGNDKVNSHSKSHAEAIKIETQQQY